MSLTITRRDELIEGLARKIAHLGLTTPAILFLEAHKPLSFLGSQALLFSQPLLGFLLGDKEAQDYALLLEDRENVERLLRSLEQLRDRR
ncbi:MAG: hypothetical protein ACE5MB_10050 [Anaerolineae bacterium]